MNLKTFLITALGGCITISAGAQSPGSNKSVNSDRGFSVGLNTGICRSSHISTDEPNDPGKIGGTLGIGLYYRFNKHWEFGLTTDYKTLSNYRQRLIEDENGTPLGTARVLERYSMISNKAVVNYHFKVRKLDMYTGVSAGVAVIAGERKNLDIEYNQPFFSYGAHIGANYRLNSHWSLNSQFGIDAIPYMDRSYKTAVTVPSATIGIRFHF